MKIKTDENKINQVLWDAHIQALNSKEDRVIVMKIGNDDYFGTIFDTFDTKSKKRYYDSVITYLIRVSTKKPTVLHLICSKGIENAKKGIGKEIACFKWGYITPNDLTQIVRALIESSYEMMKYPML